ncbi:hypothetical protein AB0B45_25920 [Nonomuraea sp. NPDC049152]|uniref:hypothetical protein n=1 Tax=Nonomuraea sp. NPDC049152 TaxID=3154350 RepID=UPI0033E89984
MTTDAWEEVKAKFAKLLGRGDVQQVERYEERLERSRAELTAAASDSAHHIRARNTAAWRTRLVDLLEDDPHREAELRELVIFIDEHASATAPRVGQVNAQAFDRAQQANLGQGVMDVSFGPSDEQ